MRRTFKIMPIKLYFRFTIQYLHKKYVYLTLANKIYLRLVLGDTCKIQYLHGDAAWGT